MNVKGFFLALFFFFVLFPSISFAADFTVSGNILDQKNNPVAQGIVVFTDGSGKTIAAATSDFSGFYTVSVAQGTYSIAANGPKGTSMHGTTLANKIISSPSILNFTLNTPVAKAAQKPTTVTKFTPVIIGILALLLVVLVAYNFWRKEPSLPQPGSPY